MKKIFAFGLLITISVFLQAQNSWTQKASLPAFARCGAVAFSVGNYGFVGTGYGNNGYFKDFWKYDPTTDTWSQVADLGGVERTGAFAFTSGASAYVGAGNIAQGVYTSDFWQYDPSANSWIQKTSYPYAVTGLSAFAIGQIGYAGMGSVGGFPNTAYTFLYSYDPVSDTWTQRAGFPGTRRIGPFVTCDDQYGYFGTGLDSSGLRNDFWKYDPLSDSWSQLISFPGTSRFEATGFCVDHKIFFGVGNVNNYANCLNDFWQYDPLTDSWQQINSLPGAARFGPSCFVISQKAFLSCGVNALGQYFSDLWEFEAPVEGISTSERKKIQIYPDPSSEEIHLPGFSGDDFSVLDACGKEVKKGKVPPEEKLDIDDLSPGIYFIRIGNSATCQIVRFIHVQ